ncbi:MAG: 2,3-diphosphoglycerate-dependent phosphoglycerate mutase [Chryseolinea sp.]
MATLALVRHGQSEYNFQNRFTGQLDVQLTETGKQEAVKAATILQQSNIQFSDAFTSGLKRAQETLKIILTLIDPENKIPVVTHAALNERNYGMLQGLDKKETASLYSEQQVNEWRRGFLSRPPGGESLEDTFKRVIPYFNSSIRPGLQSQRNVLVVAHGNSLRALMMYLENISPLEIEHVEIATGVPKLYELTNEKLLALSIQ